MGDVENILNKDPKELTPKQRQQLRSFIDQTNLKEEGAKADKHILDFLRDRNIDNKKPILISIVRIICDILGIDRSRDSIRIKDQAILLIDVNWEMFRPFLENMKYQKNDAEKTFTLTIANKDYVIKDNGSPIEPIKRLPKRATNPIIQKFKENITSYRKPDVQNEVDTDSNAKPIEPQQHIDETLFNFNPTELIQNQILINDFHPHLPDFQERTQQNAYFYVPEQQQINPPTVKEVIIFDPLPPETNKCLCRSTTQVTESAFTTSNSSEENDATMYNEENDENMYNEEDENTVENDLYF